jgi:hypothetical protein
VGGSHRGAPPRCPAPPPLEGVSLAEREQAKLLHADDRRCRLCGNPAGRVSDECESCTRQAYRIGGVTECCRVLPMRSRGVRYCPACPGPGKAGPVMITSPDGHHELASYHPPNTLIVGTATTLRQIAEHRGVTIGALVLSSVNERDWRIRRLANLRKRDVPTLRRFVCTRCGKKTSKLLAPHTRMDRVVCDECKRSRWLKSQARRVRAYFERQPVITCPSCGNRRRRHTKGICAACYRRSLESGGRCQCGTVLVKLRRQRGVACPKCTPASKRYKSHMTEVEVTDGCELRTIMVSVNTPIGVGLATAGSWIAPVILTNNMHHMHPPVTGRPVISGLLVPNTGAVTRSLLPLLEQRASENTLEVLRTELGDDTGKAQYGNMIRAGLLTKDGLTPKARAVLRWCQQAGVRL